MGVVEVQPAFGLQLFQTLLVEPAPPGQPFHVLGAVGVTGFDQCEIRHIRHPVQPRHRLDSPLAYWLLVGQRSAVRPEGKAFSEWLRLEAAATRHTVGEVPDPDLNDNLD